MALPGNGLGRRESVEAKGTALPNLTFAEAYLLRKTQENDARHRKNETSFISNMGDLYKIMKQIKQEIEGFASLKKIKNTLELIPSNFAKYIPEWYDEDNLDILHLAIVHNKPSVVTFLLVDTQFFPLGHTPQLNPYAHLAAMTGNVECLKAILQHRPGFYFASEKPCHAIKLPDDILRKLKANEKPGVRRQGNRLLENIKMTVKDAEKKIQKNDSSASLDVAAILEKDMRNVDTFKNLQKHLTVHSLSGKRESKKSHQMFKKDRYRTNSVSMSKTNSLKGSKNALLNSSVSLQQSTVTKSPVTLKLPTVVSPAKSIYKPVCDRIHLTRRLNPTSRGHLITVFWDCTSEFDQGVVRGAGHPVQVQYAPDSHLKPTPTAIIAKKQTLGFHNQYALGFKRSKSSEDGDSISSSTTRSSVAVKKANRDTPSSKSLEIGIRGFKRYKQFQLKRPEQNLKETEERETYMHKTPLTYAAEKGYEDCMKLILNMVIVRRNPTLTVTDPITLATKARSPETILLLISKNHSSEDFQNAVLLSIREMFPDCLAALLSKRRSRKSLFEGVNLYHILYSQCVISGNRYELMPEMTQTLVSCKEDVNAHNVPMTFPMYTLINSAFNITIGKQVFFFIECLYILLENKANPHFNEEKQNRSYSPNTSSFSRKAFSSAINCIFGSAKTSVNFFEKSYWSKLFMKKFITTIEERDRTQRRVLNNLLFDYMEAVCELGLDKTIILCLLRYGGNPDHLLHGKYAVNVYFDRMLPYMKQFEISNSYDYFCQELDTLMIICKHMGGRHLRDAMLIFLQDHLLSAPIQALPITRSFAARMDHMVRNPRTLSEMSARTIWVFVKRNKVRLNSIPWPKPWIDAILP